jgi:Phosphodiester glycosidase
MHMRRKVSRGGPTPEWSEDTGSGEPTQALSYPDSARQRGEPLGRYDSQRYDSQRRAPADWDGGPRKVRFRRTRRFFRRRSVRVVSAVLAVCLVWVMFSVGQAAVKNNGQGASANIAEWARDHYLGPVVTFGEWLSYNPPPKGGKPSFSLAVPSGEAVSPASPVTPSKGAPKLAFVPDIPATLESLAPAPIAGEGQWRVVERVKGEPAMLTTFLRDATYTSEVNGIASIDQRLVKFSLRPGSEDPGPANWGVPDYIPAGERDGLLATFNGGFKLDSAGGGFYLNGIYHGSLEKGTASIVYYKNGTIKIGEWGRDFTLNPSVEGVRQNLKLLVDHGKVAADAASDVTSNWGATLGGGYYVWRSGIGITKDGRVVYVYGPALDAQDLGKLLQRAGAVEGMQMDINPAWMKFDYYQAKHSPADPAPVPLLPTQQPSPYSYYTPSTRDFTAVYAR